MNDWELIQDYCRNGSESAFTALVKRHVDFVYCAALRQVRDPSLAEDTSQAVFLLLARKAQSFRPGTVLVSWLFRTTHFIAARALRSKYRRQRRELEVANMNSQTTASETDHDWELVAPVLDEALAALPQKDRDVVLLRFIARKSFSQVGAEIGVSEDAAKKRVSRALARLREFFMQRGATLSVAAIAVILAERAVQASPAELAIKIAAALSAGASTTASTLPAALLRTALRDLLWAKVKWGAAISVVSLGVLLLMTTARRIVRSEETIPTPNTPTAQSQTSVGSKLVAAPASGSNENAASRTLSLLVVRAEDRQPVQGARILADCLTGKQTERAIDAATDGFGAVDIPIPTRAFSELRVWVSAEGRVPMVMNWQQHEFNEPVTSHTLLLEPGRAAAGSVLDESGNPIPGAEVSFRGPGADLAKRENRHFHRELSASFTDANGHWETTQLPPQVEGLGVNICVTHPSFIPASPWVGGLPGFPTNAIIIMSNGVALSGRVMTADGTPIPKAEVAKQSGSAYWSAQTDVDGRFNWPHVEPGQVFVDVDAEGFETIHEFVWATNAANECAFILKKSLNPAQLTAASDGPATRLHGTVVDADTGEPILNFKVLVGRFPPFRSGGDRVLSGARLLGEGRDGRFDWQSPPRDAGLRLQVEAEGYLESVSEERNSATVDQEFNFKLRRAAILAGRVMTSDGSPAENADVSLAGPGIGPVMQAPGKLLRPNQGFETTRTRTGRDGKFRLKLKTGARGIAVIHESGSALLTFAAATNGPIVLQPWGVIDGRLYLNGQPAPNQRVSVTGCQESDADPPLRFSFTYSTTTDDEGHFLFDHVLPGEHRVAREVGFFSDAPCLVNADHTVQLKVESGAIASVELRRQGRPVTGRIVFQGSPDEVQWGMSEASLQGEKKFPFALSKDGAIRADDVPPGTYALSIQLARAAVNQQVFPTDPFGSLQKQVIVPSAENESVPVDLGELTIKRAK
jgi:RNA polymerase sigma factor (sigma-70 family)